MTEASSGGRHARDDNVNRPGPVPVATSAPDDVQSLQGEIEQTREQLGETIEQLVAKTDVAARARSKAADLVTRMKTQLADARTKAKNGNLKQYRIPLAASAVVVAGCLALIWRRKR
jgi:Protein of unknown function (DUF3618)